MARVFAGELSHIDEEVLAAVQNLPDDFWVFCEFNVGRNIDWCVIKPRRDQPSTLLMAELKRVSSALDGDINGTWMKMSDTGNWEEIPPTDKDLHYYWQAVNSANTLQHWLWNQQRRYLDLTVEDRSQDEFKIWPDLLILSPPGTIHRLPQKPDSRFGQWWFSIDSWISHLEAWNPRRGLYLKEDELERLAAALHLKPIWRESEAPADAREPGIDSLDSVISAFTSLLRGFDQRLSRLEAQYAAMQHGTVGASDTGENAMGTARPHIMGPLSQAPRMPRQRALSTVSGSRSWTEEERQALTGAIVHTRTNGKSRALPTILARMNERLGYSLKDTNYNGFGSATAMFDRARADGMVLYGPYSGPNPTIYLADESVPEE